jgi:hypothetical protein
MMALSSASRRARKCEHLAQGWNHIRIKPRGDGDLRRIDADRAKLASVVDPDDALDRQRLAGGEFVATLRHHRGTKAPAALDDACKPGK